MSYMCMACYPPAPSIKGGRRPARTGARRFAGPAWPPSGLPAGRSSPPCSHGRPSSMEQAGGTSRTCKPPQAIADVRPGGRRKHGPQAERRALDGRPQVIHAYDNLKGGRGPSQEESVGDRRRRLRIELQGAVKAGRSNPEPTPPSIRRRASRRTLGAWPAQVRGAHAAAQAAAIK